MVSHGTFDPNNLQGVALNMKARLDAIRGVIPLHPFNETPVTNETLCEKFRNLDVVLALYEARADGRDELISFDSPLCSMEELPIRVTNMLVRLGQLEALVNALPFM